MARGLKKDESLETGDFGGFCPYWTVGPDKAVWTAEAADDILNSPACERKELDPVAALHFLGYNYINGDRTMVRGVKRMPWHSRLHGSGELERLAPIAHGGRLASASDIASGLLPLLENEIATACEGREEVVILLTGGLDSRVTAGVLHRLYSKGGGPNIRAVTWGSRKSRDCVYASRIAEWYGWDWTNIPIESKDLPSMLETSALWGGAEVSGIHLHGEEYFAGEDPDTLVLASSFGDSIGRAEFSMRRLDAIKVRYPNDGLGWIRPTLRDRLIRLARMDVETAWESESPNAPHYARCELDQQDNYMRRMIVHAMNRIRTWCDLYQVFTASDVVRYMWSFAPQCRTDLVYSYLFRMLDERLWRLPWARHGVAPSGDVDMDATLTKDYHNYELWLRTDHRQWLEEQVFSEELTSMRIFNLRAIRKDWKHWQNQTGNNPGAHQSFSKLAVLTLFIRHFDVRPPAEGNLSLAKNTRACIRLWRNRLTRAYNKIAN